MLNTFGHVRKKSGDSLVIYNDSMAYLDKKELDKLLSLLKDNNKIETKPIKVWKEFSNIPLYYEPKCEYIEMTKTYRVEISDKTIGFIYLEIDKNTEGENSTLDINISLSSTNKKLIDELKNPDPISKNSIFNELSKEDKNTISNIKNCISVMRLFKYDLESDDEYLINIKVISGFKNTSFTGLNIEEELEENGLFTESVNTFIGNKIKSIEKMLCNSYKLTAEG